MAIGNPVALLARALDRETRGFISMTTMSPFVGIDRELDVRAAGVDTDAADARERGVAHALVLHVGERLRGRDRDRVAGVHAHRVEVLDRADDDDVVGVVAHHLELVLLPAEHRLLDEDLAAPGSPRGPRAATSRSSSSSAAKPVPPPPRMNDGRQISG